MFLLVPAYPGCPGQKPLNGCVCVCVCVCPSCQLLRYYVYHFSVRVYGYTWRRRSPTSFPSNSSSLMVYCTAVHSVLKCCLCFAWLFVTDHSVDDVNTEVKLSIASLSLVLNKLQYELARAQVTNIASDIVVRDGNVAITGQLGSVLLQDTSPHGSLYKERFVTTGSQALVFDVFKYVIQCHLVKIIVLVFLLLQA